MFPLGSEGGFHLRMIWDEELETEMGSNGTDGTVWVGKRQRSLHCPAKAGTSTGKFPFLRQSSIPWHLRHPAGSSRLGWMILEVSSSLKDFYTKPHKLDRRGAHQHHLESQPWFRNSFLPFLPRAVGSFLDMGLAQPPGKIVQAWFFPRDELH